MNLKKQIEEKVIKSFGLSDLALKNRITIVFLSLMLTILGLISYDRLPKESFPEVDQSNVIVGVPYPGNSPIDIENLITRPIEKEINIISEVKEIRSTSTQGFSTIISEFESGIEIEYAKSKIKDAVDKAKAELPNDLPFEPNIYEISFSDFPIMNITLSGKYSIDRLEYYAEILQDEIEKISEISKVEIFGVEEKEVAIKVDPYKLEARKLSFNDIENAIKYENISVSGGNMLENNIRRSVRIIGEFKSVDDIKNIIISNQNNKIVYLKDVAEVVFDYKEIESFFRLNGNPVVSVNVMKRKGSNLLKINDMINEVIAKIKPQLPSDIDIFIVANQSQNTKEQVSTLENNIIFGIILVVFVLLFFLGVRNALFVGLSIPLSFAISFVILSVINIPINMIILFSLVISLGLLVDNGIVVTENIYRFMEKGYSSLQATKLGIGEISLPIITSTATTIAAFAPLVFWPGLTGKFMSFMPLGLIVTLTSSLFVALVINPVLISLLMKVEDEKNKNFAKYMRNFLILFVTGLTFIFIIKIFWLGNLLIFFALLIPLNYFIFIPLSFLFREKFLVRLENAYGRFVNYFLEGIRPFIILFSSFLLFFISIQLFQVFQPKVLFFPENLPKYINVFAELPVGTDVNETNKFVVKLEKKISNILSPYNSIVESVVTNVGKGTLNPNDPSAFTMRDSPNRAKININFLEYKNRNGLDTEKIMEEIREKIGNFPGVSITIGKDRRGPPVGTAIHLEISGSDYSKLIDLVEEVKNYINESSISGIEKLTYDLSTRKPELIIDFDREKLRRFGLSTGILASELRTSLFGKEISKYKIGEDDYEIQLRLDDKYRYDVDALMNKNITFRSQSNGRIYQVPISSVATVKMSNSYGSVKRKDLDRVITLSSNVISGYNPTEVNQKIDKILQRFKFPNGYEYNFGGQQKEQEIEMAFLSNALMIALFLIFIIIIAQFNKLITPLIIMTSVILSTIGVFVGLILFNMDFIVVMTMIGIISLSGIVVNNAIVLIDFIELNRKRRILENKKNVISIEEIKFCIAEAGKTRLRPVLLTALTTIFGLLPLAIGLNFDFVSLIKSYEVSFFMGGDSTVFFGPIAWAIIFGLTFATFTTLIVVPTMYILQVKFNRYFGLA